jgi:hypothetical protein
LIGHPTLLTGAAGLAVAVASIATGGGYAFTARAFQML